MKMSVRLLLLCCFIARGVLLNICGGGGLVWVKRSLQNIGIKIKFLSHLPKTFTPEKKDIK